MQKYSLYGIIIRWKPKKSQRRFRYLYIVKPEHFNSDLAWIYLKFQFKSVFSATTYMMENPCVKIKKNTGFVFLKPETDFVEAEERMWIPLEFEVFMLSDHHLCKNKLTTKIKSAVQLNWKKKYKMKIWPSTIIKKSQWVLI